jgi:MoaA/NifB/PqqE/SkfB family radical SAM enzyme
MPVVVALPKNMELELDEIAVTVVVPAPNGCNLNCPFCFIRARKEANPAESPLGMNDFVQFIASMASRKNVGLVSLQGYEALLPESWPTSKAILEKARDLGLRTALVTNGTHLAERVDELVELGIDGITVSLDSDQAALHDHTRRTTGAFAMTLEGLRRATASPLRDRLIVASVMQSGKANHLNGMPRLLADLGLRKWAVTPLYQVGSQAAWATVQHPEDLVRELSELNQMAIETGISMLVDDEFKALMQNAGEMVNLTQLRLRSLSRLNQAIRLSPDGSCSVGMDILNQSPGQELVWDPTRETPSSFSGRVAERVSALSY